MSPFKQRLLFHFDVLNTIYRAQVLLLPALTYNSSFKTKSLDDNLHLIFNNLHVVCCVYILRFG